MTTRNRGNVGAIFMLFALLLIGFALIPKPELEPLQITYTEHAKTSHEEQISEIDNCFNGNGQISQMFKTSKNRWAQYCHDGGKNNFWRIFECVDGERLVITQFKQGVRKLANYINNHGMKGAEITC